MPITEATSTDLEILAQQLGRLPRGVVGIAARADNGEPAVVATTPRLEDGTPFPTTFYLSDPGAVKACSTLEAEHTMDVMKQALQDDADLAAQYQKAHEAYLRERNQLGEVPEIENTSAGGMPTRVKCLHALVGHSLAAGPGVNPIGDWAIRLMVERHMWTPPQQFIDYFAEQEAQ
ncbi:DUF501 domain-containing protein [Boudabousia marimammalium]|uniref:DUF501 domain-containing protein n=1 Tax=Boudabousia marimammalium TaxID=156892 RepID=UPI000A9BF6DE|nr:DUF501 domain-containing protein [Boudabousia marimammalium]